MGMRFRSFWIKAEIWTGIVYTGANLMLGGRYLAGQLEYAVG